MSGTLADVLSGRFGQLTKFRRIRIPSAHDRQKPENDSFETTVLGTVASKRNVDPKKNHPALGMTGKQTATKELTRAP